MVILSIAPGFARIPKSTSPPSRAGPATPAQENIHSLLPSTHFEVRTDVDKEGDILFLAHTAGKNVGNNITADKVAHRREGKEPAVVIAGNPDTCSSHRKSPLSTTGHRVP